MIQIKNKLKAMLTNWRKF